MIRINYHSNFNLSILSSMVGFEVVMPVGTESLQMEVGWMIDVVD